MGLSHRSHQGNGYSACQLVFDPVTAPLRQEVESLQREGTDIHNIEINVIFT